jgi:hypothetical protein
MHIDYRDGVMRIELPRTTEHAAMLTDGKCRSVPLMLMTQIVTQCLWKVFHVDQALELSFDVVVRRMLKSCAAAEEKPLLENVTQSRQRVKQLRDELEKEAKNMAEVSDNLTVTVTMTLTMTVTLTVSAHADAHANS